MAHFRLAPRALITAAMIAATIAGGAMTVPAFAPAQAQTPAPAAQPPKLNKQMLGPYNEGIRAIQASDWATAKTKLDAALALAVSPQEKAYVNMQLVNIAVQTKDNAAALVAVKGAIDSGGLTPEQAKAYKGTLGQIYAATGDNANALTAQKAFLDEYGGTHTQWAALSSMARTANDNANALIYIQKAIDAAKAANVKPPEIYYKQALAIHAATKDIPKYMGVMETLLAEYPNAEYWRVLITGARGEPGYSVYANQIRLDVYRTMVAAGVKLTPEQTLTMANEALMRVLPTETLAVLKPAIQSGYVGGASDPRAADAKTVLAEAESKAALETKGLAAEEKSTSTKGSAADLASLGEVFLTHGDYAKAIDYIQKGLAKGISDAGSADIARVHLGIAQFKAGQKDAAVATWEQVKADNGAAVLARSWVLLAKVGPVAPQ